MRRIRCEAYRWDKKTRDAFLAESEETQVEKFVIAIKDALKLVKKGDK